MDPRFARWFLRILLRPLRPPTSASLHQVAAESRKILAWCLNRIACKWPPELNSVGASWGNFAACCQQSLSSPEIYSRTEARWGEAPCYQVRGSRLSSTRSTRCSRSGLICTVSSNPQTHLHYSPPSVVHVHTFISLEGEVVGYSGIYLLLSQRVSLLFAFLQATGTPLRRHPRTS